MITVSSVSKTFGSLRALDHVSFSAPDGAVTALVGPTGSGKSTALGVVARLVRPDSGRALVDGADFTRSPRPGHVLGVHLAPTWLPDELTLESHLAHVCALQGLPKARSEHLLSTVGLHRARHRKIKDCSPAMRQRLGIAAALSGDPRNLVLDHPTDGLDADARVWLRALLRAVATRGGAVLIASDRMSDVAQLADQVVVLDRGQVVRSGPFTAFAAKEEARTWIESDHLELVVSALQERGFYVVRDGGGAVVHGAGPTEVGRVAFDHAPGLSELRSLATPSPSLDTVLDEGAA